MTIEIKNKKAFYDYEILKKYEAGIVLSGNEIKSIRLGKIQLKSSFIKIKDQEVFLINSHISNYSQNLLDRHDEFRNRKLLLHKKEIRDLEKDVNEKGLTIIPLRGYFKNNVFKLEICVAKGKSQRDKRYDLKIKDINKRIKQYV